MRYEGSYTLNVNVSNEDVERINEEVNNIDNMLRDPHNRKDVDGLDTILFEIETMLDEYAGNLDGIDFVAYGKLNTDTGYNNFVSADMEIETVDMDNEYNVKLSNVKTYQELN